MGTTGRGGGGGGAQPGEPAGGAYLGDQTGHLVAVELVQHTAVDVDRHLGWL